MSKGNSTFFIRNYYSGHQSIPGLETHVLPTKLDWCHSDMCIPAHTSLVIRVSPVGIHKTLKTNKMAVAYQSHMASRGDSRRRTSSSQVIRYDILTLFQQEIVTAKQNTKLRLHISKLK